MLTAELAQKQADRARKSKKLPLLPLPSLTPIARNDLLTHCLVLYFLASDIFPRTNKRHNALLSSGHGSHTNIQM